MPRTLTEKIIAAHTGDEVSPGAMVELAIDLRVARDFGGANVVANLETNGLGIADPERTVFTFDCNPTGSDQGYAANQQRCRTFAREHGIRVFDIDRGIGTHLVIEEGLVGPGDTFVSTDSHANIMGAVGAFGQGMGDLDIAHAFAHGSVWFRVPPTVRVLLKGEPSPAATAKDLTLALLRHFGARGLLGRAAEVSGPAIETLDLAGRITLASMATEMGAILLLPHPSAEAETELALWTGRERSWPRPDPGAAYEAEVEVDVDGLGPLVSRPGHPEDVVPVSEVEGEPIGSVFIGSCTNGRLADLTAAAGIMRANPPAAGVVVKVVPATDRVWREALAEGIIGDLKEAGTLLSNAGCAGCAAGQVGQTGPGEVALSTGNRNFAGKQGLGEVWLASPETAAASAAAGHITTADRLAAAADAGPSAAAIVSVPITGRGIEDGRPYVPLPSGDTAGEGAGAGQGPSEETGRRTEEEDPRAGAQAIEPPLILTGRVWILDAESVDTDMIFHNRHLAVVDIGEMGQFALGNIPGWEDFPRQARPGDILVTGANFGAGSSRQQAVDCFRSLGLGAIIAASYGAIYERNAINSGFPILQGDLIAGLETGDEVQVDLEHGIVLRESDGAEFEITPMSEVQLRIYRRGGLLAPGR